MYLTATQRIVEDVTKVHCQPHEIIVVRSSEVAHEKN